MQLALAKVFLLLPGGTTPFAAQSIKGTFAIDSVPSPTTSPIDDSNLPAALRCSR